MTQQEALKILKTGANVFLTGEPGSGKSFTVNEYVRYLREHGIEPSITASTGIAATHVGGQTIHSWSGIGIKKNLTDFELDAIASKEYVAKKIDRAKVLIIDEVSMLDAATLEAADHVCRLVKRVPKPFGGLQVILVGDFFQLPPVSNNRPSNGSDEISDENAQLFRSQNSSEPRFAFESRTWQELNPIVCYLTEQHRQDDGDFLSILTAIRRNQFNDSHMQIVAGRIDIHEDIQDEIPKLFSHNVDVERINDRHLGLLEDVERIYKMESNGPTALVEALKRGCLSPENLCLKPGAVVMFTKNNMQEGFVNGTLGEVVGFDDDTNYPIVRTKHGDMIEATPMEWTVEENGKVKARITQIPLRLAWAITIHKSQGMSMDAALIDLTQVFEYGQGYVALSRVRRLSGLYLLGSNERAFQVHPQVLKKDREFHSLSQEASEAFARLDENELAQMQDNFILASGGAITPMSDIGKGRNRRERKSRATGALAKIREAHPNAFAKWTHEEEERLKAKFENGYDNIEILAEEFGRKPGGIRSRLVKLGLIEEEL